LNPLDRVTSDPSRSGIFCDFDGTLSAIVDRPEDALPVEGAAECLSRLARTFAVVGVISGRSLDDLRSRFAPEGVLLAGSYGRDRSVEASHPDWSALVSLAADASTEWDGVRVEPKDTGVALHYRQAPDRAADVASLASRLASEFGMEIRPGRMVVELTDPGPGKAGALRALVAEHGLRAFLFAGDDIADGEAFVWARSSGISCVLIGIRSAESPEIIAREADVIVDAPHELVDVLNALVRRPG
jgi:trehalose 6-phosphate phosphatase